MTEITSFEAPTVPGWEHKAVDYDNIHLWRKVESADVACCHAGPDSLDRACAMLEGRAAFPVYQHVGPSCTWFFDAAGLLYRYGLELVPLTPAAPCPP